MRTVRWIAGIGAALVAVLLVPTASATPTSVHCYTNVSTSVTECFDSEAEAKSAGEKASIADVAAVTIYQFADFRGHSHTINMPRACTTPKTGLPEGHVSFMSLLRDNDDPPTPFWNNQVRSLKTFNNCNVKFFDGPDFSECATIWLALDGDLSTGLGSNWNDRASSLWIS